MDKSAEPPTPEPKPTDDESISTSTGSDIFETWTLVTDKNNLKKNIQDANNRMKILETKKHSSEEVEEDDTNDTKPDQDSTTDDFSDGISIISESDSTGRISPHPYLREHLGNLNLKFNTGDNCEAVLTKSETLLASYNTPVPIADANADADKQQQLRQRRRQRSTSTHSERTSLQVADATVSTKIEIPPNVRRGLAGIFYLGVILALLAFIGNLRYTEWQPLSAGKPMAELEQKLTDMELQNNLMRAEIDLLTKQVNHLNTLSDPGRRAAKGEPLLSSPHHQHPVKRAGTRENERKAKTFKAWSGNGNAMDPVDITKGDLKSPYKCIDGKFVEIAGMCVDKTPSLEKSVMDQIGNVVNEMFEQSEASRLFNKMAEKYNALGENAFENAAELDTEPQGTAKPQQDKEMKSNSKFIPLTDSDEEQNKQHWDEKYAKAFKHSEEIYEKYAANAKQRGKNGKYVPNMKPYDQQQKGYNSKERFDKDRAVPNSKERFNRHDNKPRYNDDNAKERHDKQWRKSKSGEHFLKDGHWQEKLMQQRENARRQTDRQRNEKNWYIERGDSREKMRHSS